jgi:hypothetical protein
MTAMEVAIGFSIVGSVLAVALPALSRDLHWSRFAEPVAGLGAISEAAVAYAAPLPVERAFPPSAAVTPSHPPRGVLAADPPGTWQSPTWVALHFPPPRSVARPFADGEPHAFAFGFDSSLSRARSAFVAHAHADLDGDGAVSTFEVRGHDAAGDPAGPTVEPGMFVENRIE